MKIAVCIKRVPDMDLRFAIGAGGKALDPAGLKYDIADFDGYAVEAGLRLVEQHGTGEVVVVSVGPVAVQETLRKALGMGAHRAIQLDAEDVPFDGRAIATALAAELKDGGYDLVLFGRMATDSANQTVGPMTAAPDGGAVRHRHFEARRRWLAAAPPSASSRAPAKRWSSRCRPSSPSTKAWGVRGSRRSRASWPPRRSRSRSSRPSSVRPA